MAYQKKTAKPEEKKTEEQTATRVFSVEHVFQLKDGTPLFNLVHNGVYIYGCSVREKDGVPFITFPSYKGKDGKYYHHAYIKLTDEETEAILEQL